MTPEPDNPPDNPPDDPPDDPPDNPPVSQNNIITVNVDSLATSGDIRAWYVDPNGTDIYALDTKAFNFSSSPVPVVFGSANDPVTANWRIRLEYLCPSGYINPKIKFTNGSFANYVEFDYTGGEQLVNVTVYATYDD